MGIHINLIQLLGCDEAIDHKATRFEDHVRDVDVVLDPVSADLEQKRLLEVHRQGGILAALMEGRKDLIEDGLTLSGRRGTQRGGAKPGSFEIAFR